KTMGMIDPNHRQTKSPRSAIIVEAPRVTIIKATFEAPDAAAHLERLPESEREPELRRMLELGSQAIESVRTSTTIRMVEAQIGEMSTDLRTQLTTILGK